LGVGTRPCGVGDVGPGSGGALRTRPITDALRGLSASYETTSQRANAAPGGSNAIVGCADGRRRIGWGVGTRRCGVGDVGPESGGAPQTHPVTDALRGLSASYEATRKRGNAASGVSNAIVGCADGRRRIGWAVGTRRCGVGDVGPGCGGALRTHPVTDALRGLSASYETTSQRGAGGSNAIACDRRMCRRRRRIGWAVGTRRCGVGDVEPGCGGAPRTHPVTDALRGLSASYEAKSQPGA
jgi:hypothetical protein